MTAPPEKAAPSNPAAAVGPAAFVRMTAPAEKAAPSNGKKTVTIYTDGGCLGNPGPGGYGVVLISGPRRRELSGGFRKTTNNRMELLACVEALSALKFPCRASLRSDSQYVVNGIEKGWARRWRSRGWRRNKTDMAENIDLWARLLDLCDVHDVTFQWVRGHAGDPENERCDRLANAASAGADLRPDTPYETNRTRVPPEAPDFPGATGEAIFS